MSIQASTVKIAVPKTGKLSSTNEVHAKVTDTVEFTTNFVGEEDGIESTTGNDFKTMRTALSTILMDRDLQKSTTAGMSALSPNEGTQEHLRAKYQMCKSHADGTVQRTCLEKLVKDAEFVTNVVSDTYRRNLHEKTARSPLLGSTVPPAELLKMYVDLLDVTIDTGILTMAYESNADSFFEFFLNIENLVLDLDKDMGNNSVALMFERTKFVMRSTKEFTISTPLTSADVHLQQEKNIGLVYAALMELEVRIPFQREDTEFVLPGDDLYYVISPLLSVCPEESNDTAVGLSFTLEYSETKEKLQNNLSSSKSVIHCGFISRSKRRWSTEGCEVVDTTDRHTTCKCNHTTNFAVLMQITEFTIDEVHDMALNIITYVGCSVSLITQIITVTVFTCVGTLNSERIYVHRNLCFAIIAAQITFLAGIKAVNIKVLCSIVALILHYFYTAVFVWMLVEGLHLYSKVVQVFGTEKSRVIYYCGFGWGLPLVLVTISATADWRGYGTEKSCWLSTKEGTIWAFVGPAVAIIVVNMVILWMVIRVILKLEKTSDYDQIKAGVKGALFLLPLLGLTWIFGLMAVNEDLIVFQYLFAIFNSLQGFFIFLFHCVCNSEVRQALQRMREKRILQRGDLNSNSSGKARSFSWAEESSIKVRPRRTLYKKDTVSSQLTTSSGGTGSTGGRDSSRSNSSKSSDDIVLQDFSSEEDAMTLMYI